MRGRAFQVMTVGPGVKMESGLEDLRGHTVMFSNIFGIGYEGTGIEEFVQTSKPGGNGVGGCAAEPDLPEKRLLQDKTF